MISWGLASLMMNVQMYCNQNQNQTQNQNRNQVLDPNIPSLILPTSLNSSEAKRRQVTCFVWCNQRNLSAGLHCGNVLQDGQWTLDDVWLICLNYMKILAILDAAGAKSLGGGTQEHGEEEKMAWGGERG